MVDKYYTDFYSFVLYSTESAGNIKREDRSTKDILEALYGAKAKEEEKKLIGKYQDLELDNWDAFACWCDVQTGNIHTPEDLGKEVGLSPATIRKRLTILGIPKYNGNESNPFGKRFIPDQIYGILKEKLENWSDINDNM